MALWSELDAMIDVRMYTLTTDLHMQFDIIHNKYKHNTILSVQVIVQLHA